MEETAAFFDGVEKPDTLAQTSREAPVISIRRWSLSDDERDDDFIYSEYSGKVPALESYELQRPQLVLERDRWGHTKGRDGIFPFEERI